MVVDLAEKQHRKRILAVFLGVLLIMGVIALVIILYMENMKSGQVIIEGFADCVKDISDNDRARVYKGIYGTVGNVNRAKKLDSQKYYNGEIRKNTCNVVEKEKSGQKYTEVEFILDIPKAKYSFRILFSYISTKTKIVDEYFDVGNVFVYCVEEKDRIYDDFGCTDTGAASTETDPILLLAPKVTDGCYIQPTTSGTSNSGYSIIIVYDPPSSVYMEGDEVAFKADCKAKAMKYLEENKINLDDYLIFEKTQIVK